MPVPLSPQCASSSSQVVLKVARPEFSAEEEVLSSVLAQLIRASLALHQ